MLIGTYWDKELQIANEIECLLRDAIINNITVTQIKLTNKDCKAINNIISDFLCLPSIKIYPLTFQIHKRTLGNPFFARQTIKLLFE